jgi:methylated-DNA-protein-cysteine methyltransferase-like protein
MKNNISDKIYELVSCIPVGRVMTYGQIAEIVGTGPRVAGNILHKNDNPQKYPCHRVVRKDGSLASGYAFGGTGRQRLKLEQEGLIFSGFKIDLASYLWLK